jgi:hypothetical protein
MPIGGNSEQQHYFKENFEMETTAAGYTVTQNEAECDYILKLEIKPNMIQYEDGTEEPAPPDEKQFLLQITLIRNEDKVDIVMFDFMFTELEEMYAYNLYLLYQAMANVPMTKLTANIDNEHWRNKWVYLRFSAEFNISAYMIDQNKPNKEWDPNANTWNVMSDPSHGREVPVMPGATLGVEFQFLNWMSAEGAIKLVLGDPEESSFIPAVSASLKFPIKPGNRSRHFMLEPYIQADLPMATGAYIRSFALLSVGGGFQFGVRGGEMGAFFIDMNGQYSLGEIHTVRPGSRDAYWTRWVIGVGIGYKIGFYNRMSDDKAVFSPGEAPPPAEVTLPPAEEVPLEEPIEEPIEEFPAE